MSDCPVPGCVDHVSSGYNQKMEDGTTLHIAKGSHVVFSTQLQDGEFRYNIRTHTLTFGGKVPPAYQEK